MGAKDGNGRPYNYERGGPWLSVRGFRCVCGRPGMGIEGFCGNGGHQMTGNGCEGFGWVKRYWN